MKTLIIRDADAFERLWTDLEGREEVDSETGADATPTRRLMDWLADYNTTPLCVPIPDDHAQEITVAIESMKLTFDEGADGVSIT